MPSATSSNESDGEETSLPHRMINCWSILLTFQENWRQCRLRSSTRISCIPSAGLQPCSVRGSYQVLALLTEQYCSAKHPGAD